MIVKDEEALICDFAETYHIYDYRSLPAGYAATLAVGLRENSRIKQAMSGSSLTLDNLLMAQAVDLLALNFWAKTKAAEKGRGRPKSVLQALQRAERREDIRSYASGSDFEAARKRIIGE